MIVDEVSRLAGLWPESNLLLAMGPRIMCCRGVGRSPHNSPGINGADLRSGRGVESSKRKKRIVLVCSILLI